jgi:hypothetical protein
LEVRTYIPEPKRRAPWKWRERSAAERRAVLGNRRRVRGARSKKLQRSRSELIERSFAHVCETGGARRCWLHGLLKISKRYLLQAAARNLGLLMRKLFRMGTPRGLQKEGDVASFVYFIVYWHLEWYTRSRRALNAIRRGIWASCPRSAAAATLN